MSTLPDHILAALPESARERFATVEDTFDNVIAPAQAAAFASDQSALERIKHAEAALARYYEDSSAHAKPPDADVAARLSAEIPRTEAARLNVAGPSLRRASRVSAGTRAAMQAAWTFANQQAARGLEAVEAPEVDGDPVAAVEAQRGALDALDHALEKVERAPRPKADTMLHAQTQLNAARERGRVRVNGRGDISWPQEALAVAPMIGTSLVTIVDAEAVLAALMYDQLAEQVEQTVEAMYRDVPESEQLDQYARRQKVAEIGEQRLAVERLEVEAVFGCWAAGRTDIGLRADCDARAILGVQ